MPDEDRRVGEYTALAERLRGAADGPSVRGALVAQDIRHAADLLDRLEGERVAAAGSLARDVLTRLGVSPDEAERTVDDELRRLRTDQGESDGNLDKGAEQ